MSRPLRKAFGLPAPERRIGLAAHDFVQASAGATVVFSRAERIEGAPTVPSRWLQRLEAVLGAAHLPMHLKGRDELQQWQARLDYAEPLAPPGPPAPRPPVAARPEQLSVTEIETWLSDPYAIYAKHVLGLRALDPLDMDPGAAERGIFIHRALDEFVRTYPRALPDNAVEQLLAMGRRHFSPALARPSVWAFWWPRFEAIARWFVANDTVRRRESAPLVTEGKGEISLSRAKGKFRLYGRADRIDRLKDGTLAIIDYKTGRKPSLRDVVLGFAPQLPLEAAMVQGGGFKGVPAAAVSQLRYWHVTGGNPPGAEITIDGGEYSRGQPMPAVAQLADEAIAGLGRLIARFDDPATPYMARPRPDYALRYNDYAHLARIKEWSAAEDDE
jgi:ATP-dependent helicase/nuclease subunit B